MSLTNPNLVYSILYENIVGKRVNPTTSAQFLDEFFKKKEKHKVMNKYMQKKSGKKQVSNAIIK